MHSSITFPLLMDYPVGVLLLVGIVPMLHAQEHLRTEDACAPCLRRNRLLYQIAAELRERCPMCTTDEIDEKIDSHWVWIIVLAISILVFLLWLLYQCHIDRTCLDSSLTRSSLKPLAFTSYEQHASFAKQQAKSPYKENTIDRKIALAKI